MAFTLHVFHFCVYSHQVGMATRRTSLGVPEIMQDGLWMLFFCILNFRKCEQQCSTGCGFEPDFQQVVVTSFLLVHPLSFGFHDIFSVVGFDIDCYSNNILTLFDKYY